MVYTRSISFDMGIKGNRTLKIIDVNGTLKFDAIK